MYTCLVLIASLALAACGKEGGASSDPPEDPAAPVSGNPAAAARAKELFGQRCVTCHGATGAGDGVASASLNPKPRAFNDAAWQASVTDEYIMQIIKFGGGAVGKSAAMPNNPDLTDPNVVAALKDMVRAFGQQP